MQHAGLFCNAALPRMTSGAGKALCRRLWVRNASASRQRGANPNVREAPRIGCGPLHSFPTSAGSASIPSRLPKYAWTCRCCLAARVDGEEPPTRWKIRNTVSRRNGVRQSIRTLSPRTRPHSRCFRGHILHWRTAVAFAAPMWGSAPRRCLAPSSRLILVGPIHEPPKGAPLAAVIDQASPDLSA